MSKFTNEEKAKLIEIELYRRSGFTDYEIQKILNLDGTYFTNECQDEINVLFEDYCRPMRRGSRFSYDIINRYEMHRIMSDILLIRDNYMFVSLLNRKSISELSKQYEYFKNTIYEKISSVYNNYVEVYNKGLASLRIGDFKKISRYDHYELDIQIDKLILSIIDTFPGIDRPECVIWPNEESRPQLISLRDYRYAPNVSINPFTTYEITCICKALGLKHGYLEDRILDLYGYQYVKYIKYVKKQFTKYFDRYPLFLDDYRTAKEHKYVAGIIKFLAYVKLGTNKKIILEDLDNDLIELMNKVMSRHQETMPYMCLEY